MFYEFLKKLCEKKGTTVTGLCKEIGVSPGVQSNWKTGTIPNGKILIALADKLEVSVDYLLERTDNPEVNK